MTGAWDERLPGRGQTVHRPVLLEEIVEVMEIQKGGTYVDGTLGGGGHARVIASRLGVGGRLLGFDRDPAAVARVEASLDVEEASRCTLACSRYADIPATLAASGWSGGVDGILLDLGISSDQLDTASRGFSFDQSGPLDMRMDPSRGPSAADLLADVEEGLLADWLRRYGEEPRARRIAQAIVARRAERPIEETRDLAEIVSRAVGGRRGKRHPATRTFQALRIVVNAELEELDRGLPLLLEILKPGGRMAVISFHSLEDRRVKTFMKSHVGREESLQAGGSRWVGRHPRCRAVTRKPIRPTAREIESNPRSRSAVCRVIERSDA